MKYVMEECDTSGKDTGCKREPTETEGLAFCDEYTLTDCGKDPNAQKYFKDIKCPTYAYRLTLALSLSQIPTLPPKTLTLTPTLNPHPHPHPHPNPNQVRLRPDLPELHARLLDKRLRPARNQAEGIGLV